MVAAQHEQGWSLLCNGVILFSDYGELLPDGRGVAPPTPHGGSADSWSFTLQKNAGIDMISHDEALTRTLYEDYGEMLLAYATSLTSDRTAAEDIVRDTLIRAWRHAHTLMSRDGSVRSWLLTLAHDIAFGRVVDDHGGEASPEPWGFVVLEPVPESVARARQWFRKLMSDCNLACSIDDCVLLISELVTNAIRYGRADGDWSVRLEWWRDGDTLRVEVHNPAADSPVDIELRHPSADDEHSRGLELVAALADCWAVESSQFTGTRVTFTLNSAWKFSVDH